MDDAGINQADGEQHAREARAIPLREARRHGAGVGEMAELGGALERCGAAGNGRDRTDGHQHNADDEIDALVIDVAHPDLFVDDVALLEK